FSENAGPKNFTTIECEALEKISVYDITETTAHLVWYMATEVSELEYGPTGFVMGTGTKISLTDSYWYDLENLTPSTTYDVYVRNVCGSNYSPYSEVTSFTTLDVCKKPE